MTPAQIFASIDLALDVAGAAFVMLPGDDDIAEQVLDAAADVLPQVQALAESPGWDAGDVVAVRNILIRGLSEARDLPTADVLSYSDALARLISRAVSAGLGQEAPVVRGRGMRRRKTLADVHVEGGKSRGAAVAAGLLTLGAAR